MTQLEQQRQTPWEYFMEIAEFIYCTTHLFVVWWKMCSLWCDICRATRTTAARIRKFFPSRPAEDLAEPDDPYWLLDD